MSVYSSLEDVYNIHKGDICKLQDIERGKRVIKLKPTHNNDFSYYGEILIINRIELYNIRGCDIAICLKDGAKRCGSGKHDGLSTLFAPCR